MLILLGLSACDVSDEEGAPDDSGTQDTCEDPGPEVCGDGIDQGCDGHGGADCAWGVVPLDAGWATVTGAESGSFFAEHLAAGDVDGNGTMDLAAFDHDPYELDVFTSIGAGQQTRETADAVVALGDDVGVWRHIVADVASDGVADLVVGSTSSDVAGVNSGVLLAIPLDGSHDTLSIDDAVLVGTEGEALGELPTAADYDGDGIMDVSAIAGRGVGIDGTEDVGAIYGTRSSGEPFTLRASADADITGDVFVVGDVTGDGFDDIVLGGIRVYEGPFPAGELDARDTTLELDTTVLPVPRAAADTDGDGNADLVLARWSPNADYDTQGLGVVPGPFTSSGSIDGDVLAHVVGTSPSEELGLEVVACDLNGDAQVDLLASAPSGLTGLRGAAYAILGPLEGTRLLSDVPPEATFAGTVDHAGGGHDIACGDVDGDGIDDAVVSQDEVDADDEAIHGRGLIGVFLGPGPL